MLIASPLFRWGIWTTVLALWTFALLTPFPVQAGARVLPQGTHYPASKSLHIGIYAGLVLLTVWLPAAPRLRPWLLTLLALHGPVTEFLQNYVPMRTGTLHDVVLDTMGVGLAVLLTRSWWFAATEAFDGILPLGKNASNHAAPADRQRAA